MSDKDKGGLVLTCSRGEAIFIGEDIEVQVLKLTRSQAVLRFVAPVKLNISRGVVDFEKMKEKKNDISR